MYGADGSDLSCDEDELSYFKDKRNFSFLLNDLEENPSKKKKTTEEEYEEKRYKENKARGPEQDIHYMLPTKSGTSLQERYRVIEKVKEEKKEEKEPEKEDEHVPKSVAELYSLRQEYILKAKQDIAKLCCGIVEDPYNNIAALKKLRNYCTTEDAKAGQTVRKLAIISLTAVYNDILPSYKVKADSNLEALSKEVKVQHSYETDLLRNYQLFLDLLFNNLNIAFQSKKKDKLQGTLVLDARRSIGLLSLKSMCELLLNNYNFNLRSNLVVTIIPYGTSKALKGQLADVVIPTIIKIFGKDERGECSVELVRVISGLVKKKGGAVNPKLVETLAHVRLVELGEVKKQKQEQLPDTATLSKKQRKHRKQQAKVRKELLEAEAVENKDKQSRLQAESLDHVFVTYFRILKQYNHTELLPIALSGLSKFAHLINVDFFTDLFQCLKKIIKEETLSLSDSLNCVSTIFTILTGQGSVLDVDIGEFFTLLYQNILLFTPDTPQSSYKLLEQTITNVLKRKVPVTCQMALVKRLCTMATVLKPEQANLILAAVRRIMRAQPQVAQMLQSDDEIGKPYYPNSTDPGQANADGTVLWELCTLAKQNCHESVRTTAGHLSKYDPTSTKRSEMKYFLNFSENASDNIIIFDEKFPQKCKSMNNRKLRLPDQLIAKDSQISDTRELNFYENMKRAS